MTVCRNLLLLQSRFVSLAFSLVSIFYYCFINVLFFYGRITLLLASTKVRFLSFHVQHMISELQSICHHVMFYLILSVPFFNQIMRTRSRYTTTSYRWIQDEKSTVFQTCEVALRPHLYSWKQLIILICC